MKNGKYRTAKGSTVTVSGKYSGIFSVDFDWLEEDACSDCEVDPVPSDGRLTWSCEYCDGGSAELAEILIS